MAVNGVTSARERQSYDDATSSYGAMGSKMMDARDATARDGRKRFLRGFYAELRRAFARNTLGRRR